jgi:hypothetical protein
MSYYKDGGNGWTFTTLLAHLTSLIASNDKRYLEMFGASERATGIAMVAAEKAITAATAAAEKAVLAALAATDKAATKAEESQVRVNEGQNEFRAQLKDQAATFVTTPVLEALEKRVQLLERSESGSEGGRRVDSAERLQRNWLIGLVVATLLGATGLILSLVAFLGR